ncbi:MAG: hypothetical protein JGK40_17275 [Microcoleus sp. PH2017_21_RUC_O_A]|nr:hypothetical protein [Microcoleus sp. PH2017_21_RUC_O_A]
MTDNGADKCPIPYSPRQFFSIGSFAFGLQHRALGEVESPCRFLKDDGNAESDWLSLGSGDGEMQREKICI